MWSRVEFETWRSEMAGLLGLAADQLGVGRSLAYMERGVFVDLHIGRARGEIVLKFEDLGIRFEDDAEREAMRRALTLGKRYVLPVETLRRFARLENQSRDALRRHALALPNGNRSEGVFVPVTAFAPMWESLVAGPNSYRARYLAIADEVTEPTRYAELRAEAITVQRAAANRAFVNLAATLGATRLPPREQFVADYVDAFAARIPTAAAYRASIYFETDLVANPLPHLLAEEDAESARLKAEATAVRLQQVTTAERVRIEQEANAGLAAKLDFMNRQVVEQARADRERLVREWWEGVVTRLARLAYTASVGVLTSHATKGEVDGQQVNRLRAAILDIKRLNFVDWGDMAAITATLEAALAGAGVTDADLVAQLGALATLSRAQLLALGDAPTRDERELPAGVALDPAPLDVRVARDTLGLPLIPVYFDADRMERGA